MTGQCVDDSGLEEHFLSVSIYPNPSRGSFSISGSGLQHLDVSDIFGRKVPFDLEYFQDHIWVQLVDPLQGFYLLRGKADGRVFNGKVLIGPAKK
jgi:hypothetical protein